MTTANDEVEPPTSNRKVSVLVPTKIKAVIATSRPVARGRWRPLERTYRIFPLNSFLACYHHGIKLKTSSRRSDLYSSDNSEFLGVERQWQKPWTTMKCSAIVDCVLPCLCLLSRSLSWRILPVLFAHVILTAGNIIYSASWLRGFLGHDVLPLALHSSISMSTVSRISLYIL